MRWYEAKAVWAAALRVGRRRAGRRSRRSRSSRLRPQAPPAGPRPPAAAQACWRASRRQEPASGSEPGWPAPRRACWPRRGAAPTATRSGLDRSGLRLRRQGHRRRGAVATGWAAGASAPADGAVGTDRDGADLARLAEVQARGLLRLDRCRRDRAAGGVGHGVAVHAHGLLHVDRLLLAVDHLGRAALVGALVDLLVLVRDLDPARVLRLDLGRLVAGLDQRRLAARDRGRAGGEIGPAAAEHDGADDGRDGDHALAGAGLLDRRVIHASADRNPGRDTARPDRRNNPAHRPRCRRRPGPGARAADGHRPAHDAERGLRIGVMAVGRRGMTGLRSPDRRPRAGWRHSVADGEKIVDGRALLARTGGAVIGQNRLKRIVLPHDPGQFRQRIAPRRRGPAGAAGLPAWASCRSISLRSTAKRGFTDSLMRRTSSYATGAPVAPPARRDRTRRERLRKRLIRLKKH